MKESGPLAAWRRLRFLSSTIADAVGLFDKHVQAWRTEFPFKPVYVCGGTFRIQAQRVVLHVEQKRALSLAYNAD